MLKTMRLISVAAVAALALPAASAPRSIDGFEATSGESGWQLAQPVYGLVVGKLVRADAPLGTAVAAREAAVPAAGFEPVGGDAGWSLSQHKYVLAGGRFAMSDECDHAVRIAQAATPADIETARKFSPGV